MASKLATSSARVLPPPTQMVFDILRQQPPTALPTTADLFRLVHDAYPLRTDKSAVPVTLPRGWVVPEARKKQPFPGHPISSKTQLKESVLPYLVEKKLIKKSYSKAPLSASGPKGTKATMGTFYWTFRADPLTEDGSISPAWQEVFASHPSFLPLAYSTPSKVLAWENSPLPTSATNKHKEFVPGKFGLPSPNLKAERKPLSPREAVVKELKKYHIMTSRGHMTHLPDVILHRRAWVKRMEATWAEEGGPAKIAAELEKDKKRREGRRAKRRYRFRQLFKVRSEWTLATDPARAAVRVELARATRVLEQAMSERGEQRPELADEVALLQDRLASLQESTARRNIKAAFGQLVALEENIDRLLAEEDTLIEQDQSVESVSHELDLKTEQQAVLEADIEALRADLEEAEKEEARHFVMVDNVTFRAQRQAEKDQRELVERRLVLEEERKKEALRIAAYDRTKENESTA